MADTKISGLTSATTPLAGTEVLPIVQSSTTKKVPVSDLTAGRSVSMSALTATATALVGNVAQQGILDVGISGAASNQFLTGGVGNNAATGTFKIGSGTGRGASVQGYRGASSNVHHLDLYSYNSADVHVMRIDSNADAKIMTGNLVIGTSGKGIDFSAAGGNVLTQYKEGDFTSSVSPQTSGSITLGSTQDSLHYTKIGTVCCVQGRLTVSSVSSPDGYIRIYLPFTAGTLAEDGDVTTCTVVFNGNTTTQHYSSFITSGTDYIQVYASVESVSNSTTNCANYVQAGSEIFVNATYVTT